MSVARSKHTNTFKPFLAALSIFTFWPESCTEKMHFSTALHVKDALIHLYGCFTTTSGLEHDFESLQHRIF